MKIRNLRTGTISTITPDMEYLLKRDYYEPVGNWPELGSNELVPRTRAKLAICTAFHGREALTRRVAKYYEDNHDGPLVAVSTGLPLDGWGRWQVVEGKANIVSDKLTHAFRLCKDLDCDAVCVIGSDDYLSPNYLDEVRQRILDGYDYVCANSLYMYHEPTGRAQYVPLSTPAGCGRALSRELLVRLKWTPYTLGKMRGVDGTMTDKIEVDRAPGYTIDTSPGSGFYVVDVKSETKGRSENIWPYDHFKKRITNVVEVDAGFMEMFGYAS